MSKDLISKNKSAIKTAQNFLKGGVEAETEKQVNNKSLLFLLTKYKSLQIAKTMKLLTI
jgi:hypothetical protein